MIPPRVDAPSISDAGTPPSAFDGVVTDPEIHVLAPLDEPGGAFLSRFRERFRGLPWAERSGDLLFAPLWSPASSLARLETQLRALYGAHIKALLHFEDEPRRGRRAAYGRLYDLVRRYYLDWPAIDLDDRPPRSLLESEAAQRYLYGRPDIVLTSAGPRVVETNFDTAVGGYERPDDMWTLAAELFEPHAACLVRGRPLDGVRTYFAELGRDGPCLVRWVMRNDDALRDTLGRLLAALDDPRQGVRHVIHYAGESVPPEPVSERSLLHRACAINTVNGDRERFAATLGQIAPLVQGCTVPVALSHLDSKLFLAILSDPEARPGNLSAQEVAAVEALLPWTRPLPLLSAHERARVLAERDAFVLKKTDSYQAKDVVFGCNVDDDAWRTLVEAHVAGPRTTGGEPDVWVVQERARPREYPLVEYTRDGPVVRPLGLACCPYLLGGRLRALETWILPATPHVDMIHRMQFVAHFIHDDPPTPPRLTPPR